MVESNYPLLNSLDFAVFGNDYVTLKKLQYQDIEIPAGFIFDGVTVKAPFTFIFSNKDLRKGIKASCFHDWLCQHKKQYSRTFSTKILVDLWRKNGLGRIKAGLVFIFVELYQICRGWR